MWNTTSNSFKPDLNKVPIQKNVTSIWNTKQTVEIPLSQQPLPLWQTKRGKTKTNIPPSTNEITSTLKQIRPIENSMNMINTIDILTIINMIDTIDTIDDEKIQNNTP